VSIVIRIMCRNKYLLMKFIWTPIRALKKLQRPMSSLRLLVT